MTDIRTDIRARTVKEFCRAYGVGRQMAYDLMAAGKLKAVKAGTRTLILEDSAVRWLEGLPQMDGLPPAHSLAHSRTSASVERTQTTTDSRRGRSGGKH